MSGENFLALDTKCVAAGQAAVVLTIARLLREHPETDGIFCNDLCAAAVLNAAMSLQLRVPEQLKIIGYDGTFLSEIVTPSITTVWQNTEKIASSAADIIVKMIDDPSFSSYHLTLGVRLIERDSTRCG